MAQGFQWGLKKTQFSTYQLLTGHCCAIITIFAPFLQTGLIILTPFSVFFGIPAVYATGSEQLHGLLRLQYFITIFGYLNSLNVSLVSGFRPAMREQSLQLYMAPYHVMAVLRTFFVPTWLGGHGPGFTPTGTLQSKVYERDASKRAPLRLRLWHICIECGAWFHALVGVTVLLSLAYQIPRLKTDEGFVMTLAWPSLIWLYILESMMKPLAYAILPPDVPERRMLLEKKAGADARYPDRKNGQARWMWLGLDVGYLRTGIALYSLVLLLRSFYR